jgi:hypothetical protein
MFKQLVRIVTSSKAQSSSRETLYAYPGSHVQAAGAYSNKLNLKELQLLNLLFMQWSRETIKDPELNMCYSIQ